MYDKGGFSKHWGQKKKNGLLIFQYHFLHTTDRINFKWIWNLNIKRETRVILEEKWVNFSVTCIEGRLLIVIQNPNAIRVKTKTFDYIKNLKFYIESP